MAEDCEVTPLFSHHITFYDSKEGVDHLFSAEVDNDGDLLIKQGCLDDNDVILVQGDDVREFVNSLVRLVKAAGYELE